MQRQEIAADTVEIPPSLRPLADQIEERGLPDRVEYRWRLGGTSGRYRATGYDLAPSPRDTAADLIAAVVALAEETDDEQGVACQHQVRGVWGDDAGRWVRFNLTSSDPARDQVEQSAMRIASQAERLAVRAMAQLEGQLRVQGEMLDVLSRAMRPQVQLRKLEIEREIAAAEAEARAEASARTAALLERMMPAILAALSRSGAGAGPSKGGQDG